MKYITYIFFRLLIFLFWITPFWLVYIHSSVIYFLLYKVLGYRKKVVTKNLKNSFPKKSDTEIKTITKKFYQNLSDILVEGIKGLSMSKKSILKRYTVTNPEVADKYYELNKSIIGIGSHYCNWEWGVLSFSLQFKHKSIGLYKPMSNKYVDRYMRRSRAAWGMNLVSIYETSKHFNQKSDEPSLYFMISDQSPSNTDKAYWIDFLNQDTACLHGPENYSKKYNMPIIYGHVNRIKRGYYTVTLEEIEIKQNSPGFITKQFMKKLEKDIIHTPENWLWSHKRWKKSRKTKD